MRMPRGLIPRVLPKPRVGPSAMSPSWAHSAGTTSLIARKISQSLASLSQYVASWAAAGAVSVASARPAPNILEVKALVGRNMIALQLEHSVSRSPFGIAAAGAPPLS